MTEERGGLGPFIPWSPLRVEDELDRLFNLIARAEVDMRKLLIAEADAKWEHERAVAIAAHDPNCPVPTRGGATVGERDSWIHQMCLDEWKGLEYAQLNVRMQKQYMDRLSSQTSIAQTMSKHALKVYEGAGSNRDPGHGYEG